MSLRWVGWAVVLTVSLIPTISSAQTDTRFDPYPLRPADTSSPRDTLRSFLTSANHAIQSWRRASPYEKVSGARSRALETLDFSQLAGSHLLSTQMKGALRLKEILDRIELPKYDEIPGDQEVADKAVTRWIIPNTRITIARIEDGPRAGEYLFSADTVRQLETFYDRSKHLAYKPGATANFNEDWRKSEGTFGSVGKRVQTRLKSVDISSPQSTLLGFRDSIDRAYALVMNVSVAFKATPPKMSTKEALEVEKRANILMRRAVRTLDLSQVSQAIRQGTGIETAFLLKEVLDRIALPPLDTVPNMQVVDTWRRDQTTSKPFSWRIPNTEIEIVALKEGLNAGRFQFSAETVNRVQEFYNKTRDLPYRSGASKGFYTYYISTPGYLVPYAHPLWRWIDKMPKWLKTVHLGQTVWQWIGLSFCLLALTLASYFTFRVMGRFASRMASPLEDWLNTSVPVIIAFIVIGLQEFIDTGLNITGGVLAVVTMFLQVGFLLTTAWATFGVFKTLAETLIASPRIPQEGIDASLLRIGARIVGFVLSTWIIVEGAHELGVEVVPLLAGLGIGGLSLALAARPTIEHLIGGIILYTDRPVRIGDFCSFGDKMGTVERIGLRSTQIRALDRTIITVPNAKFVDKDIINWARCESMLIVTTIGLRYETKPEQLRYALAKLREMVLAHPKIDNETCRVRFVGYGSSSLDVQIRVYALTREWNEFYAIQEDVFLRVAVIVEEAGTGFALPSQTLYLGRDHGLDEERSDAAMEQVGSWRGAGQLPFPNMAPSHRERLADTLDYPPHGSPDTYSPQDLETGAAKPRPEKIESERQPAEHDSK